MTASISERPLATDPGSQPEVQFARIDRWAPLVAAVGALVVTFPLQLRLTDPAALVRGQNDLLAHVAFARESSLVPFRPAAPHFLFHTAVRVLGNIGFDLALAGALVVAAASALTAVVLQRWFRTVPLAGLTAAAISVGLVLAESPAVLVQGSTQLGIGCYLPLATPSNPTASMLVPFALALFAAILLELSGRPTSFSGARRSTAVLPILAVLSTLAKPSLVVGFLPGVVIWGGLRALRGRAIPWAVWKRLAVLVALPVFVSLVVMGLVWRASVPPTISNEVSITFAPFRAVRLVGADNVKFWLAMALPVTVTALWPRQVAADAAMGIMWCGVLLAAVPLLLFTNLGRFETSVDLGNGVLSCVMLFVPASVLFLVRDARRSPGWNWQRGVVAVVAASYVVAGGAGWLLDTGVVGDPPRRDLTVPGELYSPGCDGRTTPGLA